MRIILLTTKGGSGLICWQILSTDSFWKSMEVSLENFYVVLGLKELNEPWSLLEITIFKKETLKRSHKMQMFTCNKYS